MSVTLSSTGIVFPDGSSTTTNLIPSGTSMLFAQTAAPTGWTKSTTHNDKALRVVSGSVSSGGSSAFTTALGTPSVSGSIGGNPSVGNLGVSISGNIGSTTLSINQIPSHSHSINTFADINQVNSNATGPAELGPRTGVIEPQNIPTTNTGGGGSHNHSHNLSGNLNGAPGSGNLALSSATASIDVQYVDVIIATKD